MWSAEYQVKGESLSSAYCTSSDTAQDTADLLRCRGAPLAHIEPAVCSDVSYTKSKLLCFQVKV